MSVKDWGFSKKQSPEWPIGTDGDPETPAYLTNAFSKDMAAEILVGLLESCGIAVCTKYPGDGSFGRVILGMSGTGIDLYVPESNLAEAKGLLTEFEEDNDESIQD